MQIPPKITFHNVDPSPALEARINEKIAKLDERFKGITSWRVVVESAHHHQSKGRLFDVRIDVTLPGGELVVSHHPGKNPEKHDKAFAAMNDAFSAIERQLAKFYDQLKDKVKHHEPHWLEGVIANIVDFDECGFIKSGDEEEIYFHKNAYADGDYLDLKSGDRVKYVIAEGEGEKGPQATIVKKHQ